MVSDKKDQAGLPLNKRGYINKRPLGELTEVKSSLLHHCHDRKWYNQFMRCVKCNELLDILPIYNAGQDDDFPPTIPFCNNEKCENRGLLTVVFNSPTEDENKEDKHKEV